MKYDNMERTKSIGSIAVGFLIGGLIGAAAALLMAPQSGEQTRALIRDKRDEMRDRAMEALDETRNRTEEALADARARAEGSLHQAVNEAKDATESVIKKGQKEVEKRAKRN